jgi:hypothetical protein
VLQRKVRETGNRRCEFAPPGRQPGGSVFGWDYAIGHGIQESTDGFGVEVFVEAHLKVPVAGPVIATRLADGVNDNAQERLAPQQFFDQFRGRNERQIR